MRITVPILGLALAFAGCTAKEIPIEAHSALSAQEMDAPAAVAPPVVFTPVEPAPCEATASDSQDPAERRADEKTEAAWATC